MAGIGSGAAAPLGYGVGSGIDLLQQRRNRKYAPLDYTDYYSPPPPGSYDPGIDSQVRSTFTGLEQLLQDTRRGQHRATVDYGVNNMLEKRKYGRSVTDLRTSHGRGITDLNQRQQRGNQDIGLRRDDTNLSFGRAVGDLAVARQRGEEDYQRTLTDLQHSYSSRAQRQAEAQNRSGTLEAGTTEASNAVRAANQAYDKQGIDTGHERDLFDLASQEGRINEDHLTDLERLALSQGRLNTDARIDRRRINHDFGQDRFRMRTDYRTQHHLDARDFHRQAQDAATQVSRAKQQAITFASDSAAQAYYAAHEADPHIQYPTPAGAGGTGVPGAPQNGGVHQGGPGSAGIGGAQVQQPVKNARSYQVNAGPRIGPTPRPRYTAPVVRPALGGAVPRFQRPVRRPLFR